MKALVEKTPQGRGNRSYPLYFLLSCPNFNIFFRADVPCRGHLISECAILREVRMRVRVVIYLFGVSPHDAVNTPPTSTTACEGHRGLSESIMRFQKYE
jgi:hypothetical protein